MLQQFLQFLLPLRGEKVVEVDDKYWWDDYFIRVFKEPEGFGWQIYRDNKFIYRDGKFISLVDGGLCDTRELANYHAQDYIDNCLLPNPEEE